MTVFVVLSMVLVDYHCGFKNLWQFFVWFRIRMEALWPCEPLGFYKRDMTLVMSSKKKVITIPGFYKQSV